MKNSINITKNVNLILDTYRCRFLKLLLRIFYVVHYLRPWQAKRVSKTAWKWKGSVICNIRSSLIIMAPKWLTYEMSANLLRQTKWGQM